MNKLLIFIISLFICHNLYSQSFEWAFSAGGWVDDYAIGLKTDSDSNVYLTGHKGVAYLYKFSNDGTINWALTFGSFDTYGVDVAIDTEGNVYLTGIYSHGFTIEDVTLPGGLQARIFLMKFNIYGNLIWAKDFGTINNTGRSYANAIELDSNNNIYIGGNFQNKIELGDSIYTVRGRESFDSDMLLIKLSSDGEVLSVKNPGSTSDEYIYDIAVNSDGIYAAGYCRGNTIEFDTLEYISPNRSQGFIVKYSNLGELEWVNTVNAPYHSETFSITTDLNGEIIIASRWSESNSFDDQKISIAKYSEDGKLLFNQLINQCVLLGGYVEGVFGRKRWDLTSNDRCVYLSAGLSDSFNIDYLNFTSIGSRDAAVIKFNEVGFPQWLALAKGIGDDEGLRLSSFGNEIYLAGDYSSSVLNLSDLTLNNNSGNNNNDFFLSKLIDTSSVQCPDIDSFSLSFDPILCDGDSIIASIENCYATYTEWFRDEEKLDLDNKKQIYIKKEGTYYVHINENTRCPGPEISITVDLEQNMDENTDIVIYTKPQVNIEGTEEVCSGETLTLSSPTNDAYKYSWIIPEQIPHSDTTSNTIELEMTDIIDSSVFYLVVTNNQSGCQNIDSINVYVSPLPSLSLYRSDNTLWLYSRNADSVLWYYEGEEISESKNLSSIEAANIGYYYVTGINSFGCMSTSDSIYIDSILPINIIESEVGLYPNPVENYLHINSTIPHDRVELIDISGTLLKTFYYESVIDLSDLKKGLYLLKIYLNKNIKAIKIIKV